MSLSRAFTTKRANKPSISAPMPQRSMTTRQIPGGTIRNKISAPVELISTTNMLSYNAPDLYPKSSSSSSSSHSGDESDTVPGLTSSPSTSDNSSATSSPSSPEPNHLSCYFNSSIRQSSSSDEAPIIPQRALSHTKKTHEMLHRKRSMSRMSSGKNSITSFVRDSVQMFSTNVDSSSGPEPHPFGNELAQVTELAEEYSAQGGMQVIDEEEQELISRGLFKFDADDYMREIEGFFMDAFDDPNAMRTMWI